MTPNIQKSRAHVQVNLSLPAGKWNPQVCEDLIAHSRQGLSFAAFAGVAGVSRKTLYKWLDKHPDFRAAKDLADGLSLLAWEKIGIGLANRKAQRIRRCVYPPNLQSISRSLPAADRKARDRAFRVTKTNGD